MASLVSASPSHVVTMCSNSSVESTLLNVAGYGSVHHSRRQFGWYDSVSPSRGFVACVPTPTTVACMCWMHGSYVTMLRVPMAAMCALRTLRLVRLDATWLKGPRLSMSTPCQLMEDMLSGFRNQVNGSQWGSLTLFAQMPDVSCLSSLVCTGTLDNIKILFFHY